MTYRVRNIVIAVVLAALAALMTSYYVTNYKRHVQQGEKPVQVYVASQDIPAGTPGTANQTLARILKQGDHVDVVANFAYKQGNSTLDFVATRIVLRNLKVLKAPPGPGTASKLGGSSDQKYPVVLAVTDNQSQKLMFATHTTSEENTGGGPGWWLEG